MSDFTINGSNLTDLLGITSNKTSWNEEEEVYFEHGQDDEDRAPIPKNWIEEADERGVAIEEIIKEKKVLRSELSVEQVSVPIVVAEAPPIPVPTTVVSENFDGDLSLARAVLVEALQDSRDLYAKAKAFVDNSNDASLLEVGLKAVATKTQVSKQLVELHTRVSKSAGTTHNTQINNFGDGNPKDVPFTNTSEVLNKDKQTDTTTITVTGDKTDGTT